MNPRRKVLMIAYSCRPGVGSEPGMGWGIARALSRSHDVTVVTDESNRRFLEDIPADAAPTGEGSLAFEFVAITGLSRHVMRVGHQIRYGLWQVAAVRRLRAEHFADRFEVGLHTTFTTFWMPSPLAFIELPFMFGPTGGGDRIPRGFMRGLGLRGVVWEVVRAVTQELACRTPYVRRTIGRAAIAIAGTRETAVRLERAGSRNVQRLPAGGLPAGFHPASPRASSSIPSPYFLCVGRLIPWKGYHLALAAFAALDAPAARLLIAGSGRDARRLERMIVRLGLRDRVEMLGHVDHARVGELMASSVAVVHPSLHDAGPTVLPEALAAGTAVLCLDTGGSGEIVDSEALGIKVPVTTEAETITGLARAMAELMRIEPERRETLRAMRRKRAEEFSTESLAAKLGELLSGLALAGGNGDREERAAELRKPSENRAEESKG